MFVRRLNLHLLLVSCLFFLFLSSVSSTIKKNYHGSKIIEARPNSESQSWFVSELSHNGHLHVLNPTQNPTHVNHKRPPIIAVVSSKKWPTTKKLLVHRRIEYDVLVDDYQKYIEANQQSSKRSSEFDIDYSQESETGYIDQDHFDKETASAFDFGQYNKLADIDVFLDGLQENPSKYVQVKEYGQSTEGRRLRAVHVGNYSKRYSTEGVPANL